MPLIKVTRNYQVTLPKEAREGENIKVGDTVVFENRDTRSRWPASGIHPIHLLCPGFDALRPMATGETYTHTFTEAEECSMHDHLIPSLKGKIMVTE